MLQRTRGAALPAVIMEKRFGASVRAAGRMFWSRVSSLVYLPALLVPAFGLLLVGAGWATHWGGVDFADSLTSLRFVTIGPVAVAMIGLFLVVERVRPAQARPLVARGHRHDVLFTILNVVVVLPLVTALTLSLSDVVQRVAPWVVLPRIGAVPRWGAVILILVAMDGCNWLVHLANHRIRLLWRYHELHHSQEDMNVLTVFRTHPLIHVSYVLAVVPALVLLANGELPTLLLVVYGGAVAFAHSNTNLSFGPVERVFVSPNYHRIHHRLRGPQDVNLGFTLTIWDQLTHRAVFPTPETIRADTGLPHRPLRVEQQGPRPRHLTVLAAQLVGPFRPQDEPIALESVREPARSVHPVHEATAPIRRRTTRHRESTPTTAAAANEPPAPE
jgi:sterol desaturase/sphingolipid hydroxylase (fatty acid hydroxylase superfamily)